MAKRVTMQDIADELNISKNSVSQALTGKPGVSDATRKQVYKTADKLGYNYVPKGSQANDAESAVSGNIGLIASEFAFSMKSFFGEIYLTVEEEAQKQTKNLLLQSINKKSEESLSLPSFLKDRSVDGVLILSHLNNDYIQEVINTGVPTVLVDHHHPNIEADAILTNNRFGAYRAAQHLLELGHKNIGYVGNVDFSPSYQERLEGFLLALKDYNVPVNEEFLFKDAREEDDVINRFIEQLPKQPTAWFCVNDGLGYLVNSGLKQLGIHVPDDVSICSFDNGQLSQLSTPRITSMDIDLKLFGRTAVNRLIWRMANKDEPCQEILLPAKLVPGESTSKAVSTAPSKVAD
ncbi:substrate-binding domain-containing protein [Halobacillus salinarum]|uniref:Substrate-binding domain-containing protein n=1 Tax=Halobacillus salinarum TaxID=2932257 RepID=A0ABY4ELP6_9BACI|nr:substrate-binding domain-containing protein [Halobacillus salinarum]UOQ45001.1 substrate-binding domain-containing protein [Halobacillus salinarum]